MNPTFESTVAVGCTTTVSGPMAMDAPTAHASPGPALATGTRLGEFEIVRLIGEGGFGIVYLALDRSLQREVAIKEFMPPPLATRDPGSDRIVTRSALHRETFDAGLRSFVNEARLLARFDHPSLVKVLRFWEGNGTAYMAMPYYRGPTLRHSLLAASARPSEADLLGWVHPLLDALDVLHRAQCFHRDIAPDNILLTDRGPVLLDFGAARHVIGDMTQALTVVLKPSYAPIEQYGNSTSAGQGPWTDLYALACVLHFAITGKAPVTSVERVLFDRLEPLSQSAQGRYGARLLAAIDAALALRPQDRPQDVAAFRRMLQPQDESAGSIDLPLPLDVPRAKAAAPRRAELPKPLEDAAATIATAPAAPPARQRVGAIGAVAAVAMIAATLATGWALRERVRPLPFVLPVTAAQPQPDQAPSLPGPMPVPLAEKAVEATPAPSGDASPTPPAVAPEPKADAPIPARPSVRARAPQRDAAAGSAVAEVPVAPAVEADPPPDGSRCAEILERASLGAEGADDAANLKKECR